ncbi:MAG: VOC family protein [Solirubrobacterales bacterium]
MRGINHVALVTRDLARLTAFYTEVFGAEPAYERTENDRGRGLDFLRVGSVVLHVFERPGEAPGGISDEAASEPLARGRVDHVALEADDTEEFAAVRDRLIALGAAGPEVIDFGPLVSLFATDPDGSQVEVALLRPPGWEPPFALTPPRARSLSSRTRPWG